MKHRRSIGNGKRGRRLLVRTLRWVAVLVVAAIVGGTGASVALLAYYSSSLPTTQDLRESYNPPQVNRFYAADGTIIGESYVERRTVVEMADIPSFVVNAILAAEDADFFKHEGLDYPGILRALVVNVVRGRASQGASTITQQVARTFYLGREKTLGRKIRELLLARRIEQTLSKEEILFLYLNQIYWGHGRFGIQEASLFYTGKEIGDTTLAEAALLAALPRGPELYTPLRNPQKALSRRNWVIQQMLKRGFITEGEAAAAKEEPLPTATQPVAEAGLGEEFIDAGLKILEKIVGKEKAARGGFKIYTTMNVEHQRYAREAILSGLSAIDKRRKFRGPFGFKKTKKGLEPEERCPSHPQALSLGPSEEPIRGKIYSATVVGCDEGSGKILLALGSKKGTVEVPPGSRYNPEGYNACEFARLGCRMRVSLRSGEDTFKEEKTLRFRPEMGPEAALVAIDVESSKVTALLGGSTFRRGDFDRATMARRQPGSAFKTFVYLTALKNRKVTPATMLEDTPLAYGDYQPRNYETWHFEGKVRLRKALAESINLVAVRVAELTGIGEIVHMAANLGISSKLDPNMAIALGASGVTPLELANAYATIARGGIRWDPIMITRIVGPDGKEIELPPRPAPKRVMSEEEAFIITNMLESVIKEGTAKAALSLKKPCAGKTGTSDEAKDAWFVGFTPQIAAAVWVGFDDYKPLGKNETGAQAALPIWLSFMKKAMQPLPMKRFGLPPQGIVTRSIDPETGLLAYDGQPDSITEVFLVGTEPTEKVPPSSAEAHVEAVPDAITPSTPTPAGSETTPPEGL